jgi:hypothetical protein
MTGDLSPKRPRGAPPGNHNNYKHGFYASKFRKTEVATLPEEFHGLQEEISLLRLLLRRQVEYTLNAPTFAEYNESMRTLLLACTNLNRLLRTHLILSHGGGDEFSIAFEEALAQLNIDWNLDGKHPPPASSPDDLNRIEPLGSNPPPSPSEAGLNRFEPPGSNPQPVLT